MCIFVCVCVCVFEPQPELNHISGSSTSPNRLLIGTVVERCEDTQVFEWVICLSEGQDRCYQCRVTGNRLALCQAHCRLAAPENKGVSVSVVKILMTDSVVGSAVCKCVCVCACQENQKNSAIASTAKGIQTKC